MLDEKGLKAARTIYFNGSYCGRADQHIRDILEAYETAKHCNTCDNHGQIGGFVNAESGYQTDPCPDCHGYNGVHDSQHPHPITKGLSTKHSLSSTTKPIFSLHANGSMHSHGIDDGYRADCPSCVKSPQNTIKCAHCNDTGEELRYKTAVPCRCLAAMD